MSQNKHKFTEFYYYDGESFQRVLVTQELSNSMLDNDILESLTYAGTDGFKSIVTEPKIERKCLYNKTNVPNLLYLRTPLGWELVMTDSMNVKVKGLDCSDIVGIDVRPVLLVSVTESYTTKTEKFKALDTEEIINPIVRRVPKVIHTDIYEMSPVETSSISMISNTNIAFLQNIGSEITEVINLPKITSDNLDVNSEVVITLTQ